MIKANVRCGENDYREAVLYEGMHNTLICFFPPRNKFEVPCVGIVKKEDSNYVIIENAFVNFAHYDRLAEDLRNFANNVLFHKDNREREERREARESFPLQDELFELEEMKEYAEKVSEWLNNLKRLGL